MSAPASTLPLSVLSMAALLHVRVDGQQPPIVRRGETLFPALAYFTSTEEGTPHMGATFTVAVPVTPAALLAKHAEVVRSFAAA